MTPLGEAEVEALRAAEFPALARYAYFASNGLGALPRRAAAAVRAHVDALSERAIGATIRGNPALVADTRDRVARLLGCGAAEIAFCRNTSEGVLWVASGLRWEPGDEILLVQGEYPANVLPWMALEGRGVRVRFLRPRRRRVTAADVAAAWTARTRLLAVSFVQWDSGFRADLAALASAVHERGGLLFSDAIQGLGALRLDARAAGVDFLSAGTHKWLLGLQGLGIFYCRREALRLLEPLHVAAGSLAGEGDPDDPDAPYDRDFVDEARRFEEGTRNHVGIAALAASLGLLEEIGYERIEARIAELTDRLVTEVARRGARVASPRAPGEWSGIVLFAPPAGGASAADLVAEMQRRRISINAREGCVHMGVHFYNTHADVDRVLEALGR